MPYSFSHRGAFVETAVLGSTKLRTSRRSAFTGHSQRKSSCVTRRSVAGAPPARVGRVNVVTGQQQDQNGDQSEELPPYYKPLSDDSESRTEPSGPSQGNPLQSWFKRARGLVKIPGLSSSEGDVSQNESGSNIYDFADSFALTDAEESGKEAMRAAAGEGDNSSGIVPSLDHIRSSRALWKIGWFTWWVQLVLTVIAAVIVLFAFTFPGVNIRSTSSAAGFVCAGVGVMIAFVSLFWTYGYTRLAIKLRRGQPKFLANAQSRVGGYLRISVVLAVAGLIVSLVGLQAIVGTLLARLFGAGIATTPYPNLPSGMPMQVGSSSIGGIGGVQPVDILVLQASANAMSALLASLMAAIWLRGRVRAWSKQEA